MGTDFPKISVITPSLNQCQFIEETILSVLNQYYPNLEYIIIDGGSSDASLEIIKKYEQHLAYWVSEKDNGQSHAINKGFRKASGEIICWINSDDILIPGTLRIVADYFNKHPNVLFVNGNALRIDCESKIIFTQHIIKQNSWFGKFGIFNMAQPSMFWRRELFNKIGYLNESFHGEMDKEFLIRIFESKIKIGCIDKTLSAVRLHSNTKTSKAKNIFDCDKKAIRIIYNGKYDCENYNKIALCLFFLIKMIKLKYMRDFIFKFKWAGKSINDYIKEQKHKTICL